MSYHLGTHFQQDVQNEWSKPVKFWTILMFECLERPISGQFDKEKHVKTPQKKVI